MATTTGLKALVFRAVQDGASPTPDCPALELMLAFLRYQGASIEFRGELAQNIAKATRGESITHLVQFRNLSFVDPMKLIQYFQREGLCRI